MAVDLENTDLPDMEKDHRPPGDSGTLESIGFDMGWIGFDMDSVDVLAQCGTSFDCMARMQSSTFLSPDERKICTVDSINVDHFQRN